MSSLRYKLSCNINNESRNIRYNSLSIKTPIKNKIS